MGNPCAVGSPLPHIDVPIPAGIIDLDSHSDLLDFSERASKMRSSESSSILFRYSGVITDGASSRPMSEIELSDTLAQPLESTKSDNLTPA